MKRTMLGFMGIAAVAALVSVQNEAEACRCLPPKPATDYLKTSDVVFVGTVTSVKQEGTHFAASKKYTFKVHCEWKGNVGKTARVHAGTSGAACGMTFAKGDMWLIHAGKRDDGTYGTTSCSGNKLAKGAVADIVALTKAAKAKCYDQCPPGLTNTIRCITAPCPIGCSPEKSSPEK